mgnify:CR=1 FL=1
MKTYTYKITGASDKPIALDILSPDRDGLFPMVIFVHGFKGFKDWGTHNLTAAYFVQKGFQFLKFNFSHNGISLKERDIFDDLEAFSENTFSKQLYDLDEVITFALSGEEFRAPSKLFLIGHSLGGGISIIQASEDPRINKLVTWASLSRFNNLWKPEQETTWKKEGVIFSKNSRTNQDMPLKLDILEDFEHHSELLQIDAAGKKIVQPWLIIHGENDPSVPLEQALELHRQNKNSKLIQIQGGDHVFGARHPWNEKALPQQLKEVCDITIDFLRTE